MKIAYLFGSLNRGGTETLLLDVCRNLRKNDFEAIGVYRKEGILETPFVESGVPFFKLTAGKNKITYLWKLRKLLNAQKVDVVHAQQPVDALYAKIACLFTNVKIVLTFHGFDFTSPNKLINFIIKRTDRNIFVSEYQKDYYVSKYKLTQQLQSVVYNGIDFSKLNLSDVRDENKTLKNELHLNQKTLLLGMVGNFNDVRDQYTVCRFLKLLDKKGVDFHFVFVGKRIEQQPERYDRCVNFCSENNLSDKVFFLGNRGDVPQILSELAAFIYATEHDTFGIAVVEAIAAGIPVFVNDWQVMNEITENGRFAGIYKTQNENDLLEKFMLFLHNKEEYLMKVKNISKEIKLKFGIRSHIENLKKLYSSFFVLHS